MVFHYTLLPLLALALSTCNCASVGVLHKDDANGEQLIALGAHINNTKLQVVGHAFLNFEDHVRKDLCTTSPCTLFSEWSICSAPNQLSFGYQYRTRKCYYERTSPCVHDGKETIERENRMCKGTVDCPDNYTYTGNGFCVKLYDIELPQDEAEETCQEEEGSHIMNVDSWERWDEYISIVNGTDMAWLDGVAPIEGESFIVKSGVDADTVSDLEGWGFQSDVNPDNSTEPVCKTAELFKSVQNYFWMKQNCSIPLPFVCEKRL